jgi:hypothetical protein
MKLYATALSLLFLAACDSQAPPAAPAAEKDSSSVELKLDIDKGAVGFKKDGGGGDANVDVEVKTK